MLLPIKRVCNSFLANVAQYMDNRIGLRKIEKNVILIWSITILEWISSTRKTVIFGKSMFEMDPFSR